MKGYGVVSLNEPGVGSSEQGEVIVVLYDGTILRAIVTVGRKSSVSGVRTGRYHVVPDASQSIESTGEVYFFYRVKGDDLDDAKDTVRRLLQAAAG